LSTLKALQIQYPQRDFFPTLRGACGAHSVFLAFHITLWKPLLGRRVKEREENEAHRKRRETRKETKKIYWENVTGKSVPSGLSRGV